MAQGVSCDGMDAATGSIPLGRKGRGTTMKDDLIRRQAALDALGEPPVVLWEYMDDYSLGTRNQYDKDRLAIETVPSAQRWIPCKERLPKPEEEVLLTFDYKKRRYVETGNIWSDGTAHCYADDYLTPDGRKYRKVVAWMPLPEPYREDTP